MPSPVISVETLGKRYVITNRRFKDSGLRHVIEGAMRNPLAWVYSKWRETRIRNNDFWALKDVSFQINRGDVVGIIGSNGAGKSTLLKILSRITLPTTGQIRIEGRVASLIEVGTGFHQELTGRENIFLNGAILGMSRAEIRGKFDEIVEFSEIGDFIDTPVKRYSSGMYVRLAFSVAAHLEPDILIVDEVLAVGDTAFQKKCLDKMGAFAQSGNTVLLVTHNMESVRSFCQKGIWLKNGQLYKEGAAESIVEAYYRNFSDERLAISADKGNSFILQKVVVRNSLSQEVQQFKPGDDVVIEVTYNARKRIEKPFIIVGITGTNGACFTANMLLDGQRPDFIEGAGTFSCKFFSIPLLNQSYNVRLGIKGGDGNEVVLEYQDVAFLNVVADLRDYGFRGDFLSRSSKYTSVVVPYEWCLPDGTKALISLNRTQN